MSGLTIGEVAQQVGLNTSAVRYYESIGLLSAPQRLHGQRRYEQSVVQRLNLILFAQKAGFTLTEIKTLFQETAPDSTAGERWRVLARQKMLEVDALIQRAEHMRKLLETGMQCGCLRWEECSILNEEQFCNADVTPEHETNDAL